MRGVVVSGSMLVAALALGVAPVSAAPSNAPRAETGTFDCGGGVTGTFLTNSGNSDANTWSPAFLTFRAGGTGRFIPSTFDFIITFNGQPFPVQAAKGQAPGPTSCHILESGGGFSLVGTVTGKIVRTP